MAATSELRAARTFNEALELLAGAPKKLRNMMFLDCLGRAQYAEDMMTLLERATTSWGPRQEWCYPHVSVQLAYAATQGPNAFVKGDVESLLSITRIFLPNMLREELVQLLFYAHGLAESATDYYLLMTALVDETRNPVWGAAWLSFLRHPTTLEELAPLARRKKDKGTSARDALQIKIAAVLQAEATAQHR